jgi:hypothetical protein
MLRDMLARQQPTEGPVTASFCGLPIAYRADKFPWEFHFQDAASFLLNGRDLEGMTDSQRAPFETEARNRGLYDFLGAAAGYLITAGVRGDYHEYGCFSAGSFRIFLTQAYLRGLLDMKFFAFDSFEGLPRVSSEVSQHVPWAQGTMAMSEEEFWSLIRAHGLFIDKSRTIKGFFENTLTAELQRGYPLRSRRAII